MNLTEMRRVLDEHGIQLTKSLGQNFLHDGNQLRRICTLADLQKEDCVLEIGPGLGPLTEHLIQHVAQVRAVELDQRLHNFLTKRFANIPNLTLLHQDGLEYARRGISDWRNWKLVSNLPYSVASPILVELALSQNPPTDMVVTLQWEVVKRMTAKPRTPEYGVLTLLLGQCYEALSSFKIPAGSFFPEPNVDSGCIHLKQRSPSLFTNPANRQQFVRLIKTSFSQRRKIISKLLKSAWPEDVVLAAMARCKLGPTTRAEELSLDQFIHFSKNLQDEQERRMV